MEWGLVVLKSLQATGAVLFNLAMIILPMAVLFEFATHHGWLSRFAAKARWFTDFFRLPSAAALPAVVGLFIGMVSGSGVILKAAEENAFSRPTKVILFVMIGICHSLLEETAIFIGTGANLAYLAGVRFLAAMLCAFFAGWLMYHRMMTKAVEVKKSGKQNCYCR